MTFIEFLEAMVRAIYRASPAPQASEDDIQEEVELKKMTLEERKAQTLRDKIENSIPLLAKLLPPIFMEK